MGLSLMLILGLTLLGVGAIAYTHNLPKLEAPDVQVTHARRMRSYPQSLQYRFRDFIAEQPELLKRSETKIADALMHGPRRWTPGRQRNEIMGGDLMVEDSPGNFTVTKLDETVVIRVYDANGLAWVAKYPIAGPIPESIEINRETD